MLPRGPLNFLLMCVIKSQSSVSSQGPFCACEAQVYGSRSQRFKVRTFLFAFFFFLFQSSPPPMYITQTNWKACLCVVSLSCRVSLPPHPLWILRQYVQDKSSKDSINKSLDAQKQSINHVKHASILKVIYADILEACSKKRRGGGGWGYFISSVFYCQGALSFPSA